MKDLPVSASTGTIAAWRRAMAPEKATSLLVITGAAIAFSPDGKWLLTARAPCKLWTTGTWDLGRELGGTGLCFSPDSRLVALLDASRIIRLVEVETGRVIAGIESPESSEVLWATFSPDGSRLVLVPNSIPAVRVWNCAWSASDSPRWASIGTHRRFQTMTRPPRPCRRCRHSTSSSTPQARRDLMNQCPEKGVRNL